MIQHEIIDLIATRTDIAKRDLIEKDLILHRLLLELSAEERFAKDYAFKGGTCLMKCHLSYYRFSEDLDFTFIHHIPSKSGKQLRAALSRHINDMLTILADISGRIGLDFKPTKGDTRYVELGSSNKQATFKTWYTPHGTEHPTFIKIQINFVEKLAYPLVEKPAGNIVFGKQDEFQTAFLLPPGTEWLLQTPNLLCYDIKEILIEKIRAILTRKGTKARDYIDVYMIQKQHKLDARDFRKQILEKVKASLAHEKYAANLKSKQDFTIGKDEEQRILLIPLPKDFETFMNELHPFLRGLTEEL